MGNLGRAAAACAAAGALTAASAFLAGPAAALLTSARAVDTNTFTADTLDTPTGLTATAGAMAGTIDLGWTATADTYASGHRVLRAGVPGGPYTQVAEVTPRTTVAYQDSGLTPGNTYYYVVRAYYQYWESANSNEAAAQAP